MFEVARHVRGWTRYDLRLHTRMMDNTRVALSRISQIEKGEVEPTADEVNAIAQALDFPIAFFQQWWETKLDFSGYFAKSVPIDYFKYKVFRDANPPQLSIV